MVGLSKAHVIIKISSLFDKLKAAYAPGQLVNLIEFKGKNTSVRTSYEKCLSHEWKVDNGICQGSVTSGTLFDLILKEVSIGLANIPLVCELNGNRLNVFCCEYDIELLTPAENALQIMLDTLVLKTEMLSLI